MERRIGAIRSPDLPELFLLAFVIMPGFLIWPEFAGNVYFYCVHAYVCRAGNSE